MLMVSGDTKMRIFPYHTLRRHEQFSFDSTSNLLDILNLLHLAKNEQEISFDDCYSVVQRLSPDESLKLNSFSTKTLPTKNGFLGEHFNLELKLSRGKENLSFLLFLKSIPQCDALKEFSNSVGSFFKETMFYKRYVPLLKERGIDTLDSIVPKCYHANEHKYIVLDNLTNEGYVTISPRQKLSNELIEKVIVTLAKFNSTFIILEELSKNETSYYDSFAKEFTEPFYSTVPVIEKHRNSGRGGMKALIELVRFEENSMVHDEMALRACDEQVKFALPSCKWRNTICHGDLWTKNFMVKYDTENVPDKIMLLDFQTYRYAPPAQDFMAFVYLNTVEKMRKERFEFWLRLYYETFAKCLEKYEVNVENVVTEAEFRESCEYYRQFSINQSITHFQVILSPGAIIDPMLRDAEETKKIFFGSRYDLVKKIWEVDEEYKERLTEAVSLLRKFLLSKNQDNQDSNDPTQT